MILLRHGQTVFNLHFSGQLGQGRVDPGVPDPSLTELGAAQAREAAASLADAGVRRIVTSPYVRAIETASIVGERLGLDLEVDADVRERAGYSCDIGREPDELRALWPNLDFDDLPTRWWAHDDGDPASDGLDEPEARLDARVRRFRGRVASRADWAETLVVCHWGPIRSLIGRRVENGRFVRHDPRSPL